MHEHGLYLLLMLLALRYPMPPAARKARKRRTEVNG